MELQRDREGRHALYLHLLVVFFSVDRGCPAARLLFAGKEATGRARTRVFTV